jgi:hypothetical protein
MKYGKKVCVMNAQMTFTKILKKYNKTRNTKKKNNSVDINI